jgi:hypothetical protein
MRTIFSGEDLAKLKQNVCVFSCTEKTINYTSEFKKRALELHSNGVKAEDIWYQAGFDTSKWKKNYFTSTLKDWRRIVRKSGIEGLSKLGGVQYDMGKTNKRELIKIESDKLKRLELQVKYLKAENDFLAKLRAKRAERHSGRLKNSNSSEY